MQTAAVPTPLRVAPPPALRCPRCERRIGQIAEVARHAAASIVVAKVDADAVAAEAERLARAELVHAADGCRA